MVGLDFDIRGSFKVVVLFLKALDDNVKLFIIDGIIELNPRELLRYVGDQILSIFP